MKRMGKKSFVVLLVGMIPAVLVFTLYPTLVFAAGPVSLENPDWVDSYCSSAGDDLVWDEVAASNDAYNFTLYNCSPHVNSMGELSGMGWNEAHCVVQFKKRILGAVEDPIRAWCYSTEAEARDFAKNISESSRGSSSDNCGDGENLGWIFCDAAKMVTNLVDDLINKLLLPMLQWRVIV